MQNNKKQGKYTILWLLFSVLAKRNVRETAGVEPEIEPRLDSGWLDVCIAAGLRAASKGSKLC